MAVPKRRHSRTRGAKRRTHWKISGPGLVACPQCHQPKLSHRICKTCGYYGGREIIAEKAK